MADIEATKNCFCELIRSKQISFYNNKSATNKLDNLKSSNINLYDSNLYDEY
jgi:hypothetical protein